jgi:glycosyltransferase involved in cell wall biosynthesis
VPKIFYWMGDITHASGGEKHSYQHVDLLNEAGFDAYAAHPKGARYTWFANDTRVVCGDAIWKILDPHEDYLVIPEPLAPLVHTLPGRKVIFNKNLYLGCSIFPPHAAPRPYPYTDRRVVAIFAVSEHNCRHLQFAFPAATIVRMYAGIDPELYRFHGLAEKTRRIAITDKARDSLGVLLTLLRARAQGGLNRLAEYQITFLKDMPGDRVASTLRESLMLISLSTREGLPRTVLEAMSCGCIVAAYGTGPLREILPPEYAFEPDDLIGVAKHVEAVTGGFPDNARQWSAPVAQALQTARAFSRDRQRQCLVDAWQRIFARHS